VQRIQGQFVIPQQAFIFYETNPSDSDLPKGEQGVQEYGFPLAVSMIII
jgi:hypothetical protein